MSTRQAERQQAREAILGVFHEHRGTWLTAWSIAQELGLGDDGRSTGQHLRRMVERDEVELHKMASSLSLSDHYRIV